MKNREKNHITEVTKENEIQHSQPEKIIGFFDGILSQQYLSGLSDCEIRPPVLCKTSVRWYRIDKIVMEKGVFFADKLSMLYTSLHQYAQNIVLVLNKKNGGNIELYLGARDFRGDKSYSGEILKSGLQGYLPGISFVSKRNINLDKYEKSSVATVSALASLRDDKKENFVQGLEKLINATNSIPSFRAFFIAESISGKQAYSIINAFEQIYTDLSPLAECQITMSESHSEGVSESVTKGISDSITENISKTVTRSEGYSENTSTSINDTENYAPSILEGLWTSIVGGKSGSNCSKSTSRQEGTNRQYSKADQTGESTSKQTSEQNQTGTNSSDTTGITRQLAYKNRQAQYYLDIIDEQIKRLNNGVPFGLWSVATYFVAPLETTAVKLANLYRGCIIGEESNLGSCAINVWSESSQVNNLIESLSNATHPRFLYNGLDVSAAVTVTSKELAVHLSLPQSSVPGVLVREEQSFGTNVISTLDNGSDKRLEIGKVLHLGQVLPDAPVTLDVDSLCKHAFITGTTGSGKSNTTYLLLNSLYEQGKKFLVIEPAKGEYKHYFGNKNGVAVYGSNPNISQLLRINPFSFPEGVHVFEHIDRLVEIFNACWPMYAAMPVVLKKSITDAYKKCGWNLYTSTQDLDCQQRLFPTFYDVVICLREFINNSEYSAETKGDYKGSIETRLISMSEGLTGMMLNNSIGNLSDKELFDENVIIDLSHVGNSETKSFIMGLVIMKMNEFYQTSGKVNSRLCHVTVLEEAHNILKRTSTAQSQESSNLLGKSVEMICNSIAEMRTYGEGFIIVDQSPSQVDLAAIRNTNTKIIMSLPEAEDRETAGKSIGLTDEQTVELGRQKLGNAIVYQNDWEEPVQCIINEYVSTDGYHYEARKDSHRLVDSDRSLYDMLSFLFSYCNNAESIDCNVDDLRLSVINCKINASVKYLMLKLLSDFELNGIQLSKTNHVKIMEVVASCLELSDPTTRILKENRDVTRTNNAIEKLVFDKFPDGSDRFYRFCIRCLLRHQASKSSQAVEIYNKWIKTYYR